MQTTKIATRKIDKLGRVKIPIKFSKRMGLEKFQQVEVTIEYGLICIRKFDEINLKDRPYIGIVRCLDELERFCIPNEYFEVLKIPKDIRVQFVLDGDKVIIMGVE